MAADHEAGKLAWCSLPDSPPLAAAIHCKLMMPPLDALYHTAELFFGGGGGGKAN
jgi:hypothetical protein